ncbi:hypothetical protein [Nitrosospira briensis]|uniref:hypothetical protein n=1 Tax=Nitrosospira briensis TaxID=35799 RepID=UPI00055C3056|nr:hypothetical protein [Nitrosospira briensis]
MTKMRAKMVVANVEEFKSGPDGEKTGERLSFRAVSRPNGYPVDGSDEDNTYAKWSPQADLSITVNNPALFGQFERGQKYYVDFSQASN